MKSISEIRSLRRIFFLLVISLTTLAGAAFLYILNDAKRDRINDLTNTAKVIESYYELSFHQWELSLLSVGKRLAEIETIEEKAVFATNVLEIYERELLAFGFARPDGQIIVFSGRPLTDSLPQLMQSEKTSRSFDLARRGDGISIGECYYTDLAGDWVIPIRVPIRDDDGNLLAVNTTGVAYNSMIEDLERFGFNEKYQIHLINDNFNTTQLFYPLARGEYEGILGSDKLHYSEIDTIELNNNSYITSCKDPITQKKLIAVSSQIPDVNHSLVVSVENSVLIFEVFNRFKFVLIVYVILVIASVVLYKYLRKNLDISILNLSKERANLKSIIESTSDLIGLFDKDKRLVEFNRAFKISAQRTDEITLRKGMDLLKEIRFKDQIDHFNNLLNKALSGEKVQIEIVYPGPKGDLIFKSTYNPVFNGDQVVGITFFGEDITEIRGYQKQLEVLNKELESKVNERTKELKSKNKELKDGYEKLQSAQQQLIRAEKMASLGILSAGIGHEINNPLNFIKHGALALKERLIKLEGYKEYDDYFNAIEEGVRRASQIVSGLSHFSRTGEQMNETCDVHEVLQNSLTLLTNRFRKKEIEVRSFLHAENSIVKGNEGKLHQVFTNIITNAEQAIKEKGSIKLSTRNEKKSIVVEIADTGMGMGKKEIELMTDPFYTTKDPGEGTGLGLFITQMIVDEHGGKMDVKSQKGEGTTFIITLKNK